MKKLLIKPNRLFSQISWFVIIYLVSLLGFGVFSLFTRMVIHLLKH